jgi:hypothetical protein
VPSAGSRLDGLRIAALLAQSPSTAHTQTVKRSARSEIEALERRGWDALSGPGGAAFYEEVLADDGVMVFPGLVMDKRTALTTMSEVAPWSRYELSDVRVTTTEEVGLVTYKAVGQRSGQPQYEATMSSVYVRRGDSWKLLLHQQSP